MKKGWRRKAIIVLVTTVMSCSMTSCWDRKEINELAIIGAIGIDGQPGDITVTAEIFRPPATGTDGASIGGAPGQRTVSMVQGQGPTLLEALRCMNRAVPRQIYGSHIVAIIVGEDYARTGLHELIEVWHRSPRVRMTAFLVVAKGDAESVLTRTVGELEGTIAAQITGLGQTARHDGRVMLATIHQVTRGITSESKAAVTGVVELVKTTQTPVLRSPVPNEGHEPLQPAVTYSLDLTGLALIKDGYLEAILPASNMTKSIVATKDTVEGSAISIDVPTAKKGKAKLTSVEVVKMAARTRAQTKGELKIIVEMELEIRLTSQAFPQELTADIINAIEKSTEDTIAGTTRESIRKLQLISCDVMGFADVIHREDPRLWKNIKDDWEDIFRTLPVEVRCKTHLRHLGMIKTPAWGQSGE
jgi:spore germination protein KC